MKKLLSIAVCASAVAAFGSEEVTLGTVGVTKITSSAKNTVVVTSYDELDGSGNMAVSNIVKTANLTPGDKLYVLKPNAATYEGYTLTAGSGDAKYWRKDLNYTVNSSGIASEGTASTSPDVPVLNVGQGFWLSRESDPAGSFDFYVYGKPPAETNVVALAGKTTLVGNPTQTDRVPSISGVKGDKIMVFGTGNTPTTYSCSGSSWRNAATRETGLPEIKAGTGFWYVSKGTSNVAIAW